MRKMLFTMMLVFATIAASAQVLTIKGRVIDDKGDIVPFATVQIKGGRGVSSDERGSFTIKASKGDVLTISATSFTSSEVKIAGGADLTITLTRKSEQLGEVVVTTAFGIKRAPKELGYSTQTVNNKELTKGNVTNVVNGLTGKVAGLQVQTQNSSVNADTRINLRGNRSILGNNSALVVIDGVLVQPSLINSINPNDVESVSILKGAAASTLYGSDGSNGVLVITTKKGTRGKPQVRYSSNVQFEDAAIMPNLQNTYGSYGGESNFIDPITGQYQYVPFENQSYGPAFNGQMVALGTPKKYTRADGTIGDTTQMVPYSALPKEKRKFFSGGVTMQNDISVSMGDEKSSTFMSLQNVYTRGTIPRDELRRTTARVNGFREYDKLRIDYSVSYTQKQTDIAGTGWSNRSIYYDVINTPTHVPIRKYKDSETDLFATGDGWFNAYGANPWWAINNSRIKQRREDLAANLGIGYKLTSWLSGSYRLGYSSSNFQSKNTKNGIRFSSYTVTSGGSIGDIRTSTPFTNPSSSDGSTYFSKLTGDALLTANKEFGKISTKVIVGHSLVTDYRRDISLGANALSLGNNFFNVGAQSGVPTYSENVYNRNVQGAFADVTIGYNKYLFVHGAYRSSWFSTLPQQNRRFSYGGADVSLILSDAFPELFKNGFVSYAKLRASYASVGQLSIDNLSQYGTYLTADVFNTAGGFPYGSTTGYLFSTSHNNPNLKDERTKETEIGVELGFLKNRINLQVNVYKTNTTNQTLNSQVSNSTGYTSNLINNGEVQNQGLEADLKFTPLLTKRGFRWDFGINYTYIENKVISLPNSGDVFLGGNSYAIVGQPMQALKVSDWNRAPDGRVIVDANGNPSQNSTLVYAGSFFAPHRLGINTSFSYKNLSLSITADYRGGNKIFNDVGQDLDRGGISEHSTYGNRERFVFPNSVYQDASGKYVTNTSRNIGDVYNFWSGIIPNVDIPYVTSASFWKLREVNLSYELPKKWINSLKYVKNISVAAFGRNLLTWRPKENIWSDPEFNDNLGNNDGGTTSQAQTPSTRFYGGSISINF